MKKVGFIVLLSILSFKLFAQHASSDREKLPREDTNRVDTLNKLSRQAINIGKYAEADSLAKEALRMAKTLNFKEGQALAYARIGVIYYDVSNYPEAMKNYINALKIYEDIRDKMGVAEVDNDLGLIYWQQRDYANALKNYHTALLMDEEIGNEPNMASVYGNIAIIYMVQENYAEGIKNLNLALHLNKKTGNKLGLAIVYCNLGLVYLNEEKYDTAEKSFFLGLALYRGIENTRGMSTVFTNLGLLFTAEKKYAEAKKYLDSALIIAKATDNKEVIRDTYYYLAILDSTMGLYKDAYHDFRQGTAFKLSINNEENTKKIVSEQMNYDFDKKMAAEKANQEKKDILRSEENTKKNIITYSVIIILILAVISAWLLISSEQVKRKKDKIIFEKNLAISEKENDLLRIEKQGMEDELANAKEMLEEYIKNMIEKNALLEKFKGDIDELKNGLDEKKIERLEHLNKITILTDGDWNKFKQLFEQVYKGFLKRLQEKLPDLTQSEVRLICLTKLQLGTKQMAEILAVSSSTILTSRYRLRKKLGIPEESNIDTVIESI